MHPVLPPLQRIAFSGSSTAMTTSATLVSVAGRASRYPPPGLRGHESPPAQTGEQLLEVGLRDLLALGDLGHRRRLLAAPPGEVDHRHHGIASLGRKLHANRPPYFLAISEPLLLKAAALAGAGVAERPFGGM